MDAENFDTNAKINLLTFGYIREYVSNKYKDIEIPKNIILLFAFFANLCINTKILKNYYEIDTFIELILNELTNVHINKSSFKRRLELVYRSSRDGADSKSFWKKCKSITDTFILIQNNNNHIFGCYLSIGPCIFTDLTDVTSGNWKEDKKCFIYQMKPNKMVYKHSDNNSYTLAARLGDTHTLFVGDYGGAINIPSDFTSPKSCQSDPRCQTFVNLNCKELVGGNSEVKRDGYRHKRYFWNVVEMEVFRFRE